MPKAEGYDATQLGFARSFVNQWQIQSFPGFQPSGYATMIVLCYFPPLWRRVMDKRVVAHYGGDLTRANIHPRKRAKVLAKYGTPTVAGDATVAA